MKLYTAAYSSDASKNIYVERLYFGSIDTKDDFWVNTYTFPKMAAQSTRAMVSTNEGVTWATNSMVKDGVDGQDGWWRLNFGKFSFGTRIWYWMKTTDSYGTTKLDNNGNSFYRVTVGVLGPKIIWTGNVDQFPVNNLTPGQGF